MYTFTYIDKTFQFLLVFLFYLFLLNIKYNTPTYKKILKLYNDTTLYNNKTYLL